MPICTLPTLQGKIYLINSPDLISAAFKARTLGFDPNLLKTIKYSKFLFYLFSNYRLYHNVQVMVGGHRNSCWSK